MKNLLFSVKRNLKKSPKIYVLSPDKKITYGSFSASSPEEFENWDELSTAQKIELKQYMHNMAAISTHFDKSALNEQTDFRLRLPSSFIQCINEIEELAFNCNIELDIFEPLIVSMIQKLKIVTAQLPEFEKKLANAALDRIGLAEYEKIDYSSQIQMVFSELMTVHNKAEKLKLAAKELFNKEKGVSPKAIESIANGVLSTSRWFVACAIDVLLKEKLDFIKTSLSLDDLFILWVRPLENSSLIKQNLLMRAQLIGNAELIAKIENMPLTQGAMK